MSHLTHQAIIDTIGERPDIPLVIDMENNRYIVDIVEQNRYGLCLVVSSPRMVENVFRLHSTDTVVAMAPDHRLAGCSIITPADLIDKRVRILRRNSLLRLSPDKASPHEDHQSVSTIETSMLSCCHFAAASIVNHTSLHPVGANVVAIPFELRIEVSYLAICPNGSQRLAILDEIVAQMQEML